MAQRASRHTFAIGVRPLMASYLYVALVGAVALISIGISGGVCQALGWRFGDSALAADSESAHLSAARCADLLEYFPSKSCAAAEMAHHADEVVQYRVAAGVLGLLSLAGLGVVASRLRLDEEERRRTLHHYMLLATAVFAAAAAVLMGTALGVGLRSGDGLAHWLADGCVAAIVFMLHLGVATQWRGDGAAASGGLTTQRRRCVTPT
jgi:hypothetical protein